MIQSNRLQGKQERTSTRAGGGFGLGQELPDKTQDTQLNPSFRETMNNYLYKYGLCNILE